MTKTKFCKLCARVAALGLIPAMLRAQQPSTITGRVVDETGTPIVAASIAIPDLGVGATSRAGGEYTILLPGARVQGQTVALTARAIGFKPQTLQVTLHEGSLAQDFNLAPNPLQLG